MVKAKGIDLASLLRFDQDEGRILLKGYRMVLMSATALGTLRRERIETLGWDQARSLLKRFGHAAGLADALALAERFPMASKREHLEYGPALHGLEGATRVVWIPDKTHLDPDRGHCHFEAYWENSYEAEQHLEVFGKSEEPVCWTLVGRATGHSSAAAGARTIVHETECRAMGHERCRIVGDYVEKLPEVARREGPDYEKQHLPAVLQDLLDTVKRQKRSLRARERKIADLRNELREKRLSSNLIGESIEFQATITAARTVAPLDATVLVLGESGTGKELLARLIHDQSLRRDKAFIAVNCSALPETLQEAELFGYAKGAFTGASKTTQGVFEAANGGTLFLDEIGDLSLSAQTTILRALQEGEIKRLGETRARKVNVRIVAATHRDLKEMVREKSFREDLYYRLSVVPISIPPLRDRAHDTFLLADHFLLAFAHKFAKPPKRLSREVKEALGGHPWPGNVRELQHAIERAVIMSTGSEIEITDLPSDLADGVSKRAGQSAMLNEQPAPEDLIQLGGLADEAARIRKALELSRGSKVRAAEMLGISRTTLWRRMRSHGL